MLMGGTTPELELPCFYRAVLAGVFLHLQLPRAGIIPLLQQDVHPLPGHAARSQIQQACC